MLLFLFSLLHQADRLLIGPLTSKIMDEFHINEAQMGFAISSSIIVAGILYPIWGFLSDRFNRAKLISLASFIWGTTTWFSAIARSYGFFIATRASTGVDDAAYPGMYSLISDYFSPSVRSRVFSVLKMTYSLGYVLGAVFATTFGAKYGWRKVFFLTGAFGVLFAFLILFIIRDIPRGASEHIETVEKMSLSKVKEIVKKKTLIALYAQGFFAIFPINIVTFWFFRYLETERGLFGGSLVLVTAIAVSSIAIGIPVSGILGDKMFMKDKRGRLKAGFLTFVGSLFLIGAIMTPVKSFAQFIFLVCIGCFLSSFAAPNVAAAISDVSMPEVRSTALAIQSFVETVGSAMSPTIAGVIAYKTNLKFTFVSILSISSIFWAICFLVAIKNISHDLEERAHIL